MFTRIYDLPPKSVVYPATGGNGKLATYSLCDSETLDGVPIKVYRQNEPNVSLLFAWLGYIFFGGGDAPVTALSQRLAGTYIYEAGTLGLGQWMERCVPWCIMLINWRDVTCLALPCTRALHSSRVA